MKNFSIFVLLLSTILGPLSAEVIFLRSGEIVIGQITGASPGTISIQSFGQKRDIASKDVLKTVNSLNDIKDNAVVVILKDGTNIVGKPVDVDDELGFFVDIGFGNLALPIDSILMVADPQRRQSYVGVSVNFTALGLISLPLNSNYNYSFGGAFSSELRLAQLREFYINPVITFYHLDYSADSAIDFYNAQIQLNLLYKVLAFGEIFSALEFFVPVFGIGVAGTLINLYDTRPEAVVSPRGLLTFSAQGFGGFELRLPWNFSLKTLAEMESIFQTSGIFWNFKAYAGLGYGF